MNTTILVPIDFSSVSLNALDYAKGISRILNARIVLFHSSHLQLIVHEMVDIGYSEIIEDGLVVGDKMEELLIKIRKDGIDCEKKIVTGFLADDIKKVVAEPLRSIDTKPAANVEKRKTVLQETVYFH